MSGKKGRSGGARSGAGRPKKKRPPTAHKYEDAVAYLAAVVEGTEEPDAVRVNAARSLLPYQAPRKRAPVASAPPRQLQQAAQLDAESAAREAWKAKSAEIRARLGRKES
jgi:hypothetical protein